MKNRGKKLVGLLMGTVLLLGGTMNVCAATPQKVANWSVSTYPGTSSSGTYYMMDGSGDLFCNISCNSYSSSNGSVITFSSSYFTSSPSIGGYGNLYQKKINATYGKKYYVKCYCNGSGRTIARGQIMDY